MARIDWTPEMDETIRVGRKAFKTYLEIGQGMGFGGETIRQRAKAIGCGELVVNRNGNPIVVKEPEPRRMRDKHGPRMEFDEYDLDDRDRPSLPVGHELSWAILTADTVLAGQPYPALNERNIS